jgi:hypothetical protein
VESTTTHAFAFAATLFLGFITTKSGCIPKSIVAVAEPEPFQVATEKYCMGLFMTGIMSISYGKFKVFSAL